MSSAGKLLRVKRMFIIIQTCWLVDGLAMRDILVATILLYSKYNFQYV